MQSKEFDIRRDTAVYLINALYKVHVGSLDTAQKIENFCNSFQLHAIQICFHVPYLTSLCEELKEDMIYTVHDYLGVRFELFSINGVPYVLGPFIKSALSRIEAVRILKQYHISDLDKTILMDYQSSFPCISEQEIQNIRNSFIYSIYSQEPEKKAERVLLSEISEDSVSVPDPEDHFHTRRLEQRYLHEKLFRNSIRTGNARSALYHLHMLEQDVTYYKSGYQSGKEHLKNENIGAAIDLTTARLSALDAGLPIIVLDKIMMDSAYQIDHASTSEALHKAKEYLITNLCNAILKMKSKQYSALVQSTIYYLNQHYDEKILLAELASELDISENYLIQKFKSETGVKLTTYLNQLRMQQAAALLLDKTLSIGDIGRMTGVNDANYFSKLFKSYYHQTPREYRNSRIK